jgi:dephospho-CoA kinase
MDYIFWLGGIPIKHFDPKKKQVFHGDALGGRGVRILSCFEVGKEQAEDVRVMALTGGIAVGKSTFCRFLREFLPGVVIFDCDAEVHRLLAEDAEVASRLAATFGGGVFDARGGVDRSMLRERVFGDDGARASLEEILRPRVREECLDSLEIAAKRGADLFVAEKIKSLAFYFI